VAMDTLSSLFFLVAVFVWQMASSWRLIHYWLVLCCLIFLLEKKLGRIKTLASCHQFTSKHGDVFCLSDVWLKDVGSWVVGNVLDIYCDCFSLPTLEGKEANGWWAHR
jgi:hypothetical protein